MNKILQKFIIFSIVFCYQIGQIYISNIIFIIHFSKQIFNSGQLRFIGSKRASIILYLFLIYITLNTILYSLFFKPIELRSMVQFLYNFQYLFLILFINIDFHLLERLFFRFTVILSLIIITVFFFSGDSVELFKWNELMNNYFPGWPNTSPLFLILGLFLNRSLKYSIFFSLIIAIAAVLTGSRGALLGCGFVLLLPFFKKIKHYINYFLALCLFILVLYFNVLINYESDIKLFRAFDRIDIFYTSIAYIKQSLLFGYGGNTIEQLSHVKIDYEPLIEWGHTHNVALEFALRYGLVGLILFSSFIFFKIKEIKDFDFRYMFFIFIFLAFFQTFIRDFTFLFILIYLSNSQLQKKDYQLKH